MVEFIIMNLLVIVPAFATMAVAGVDLTIAITAILLFALGAIAEYTRNK